MASQYSILRQYAPYVSPYNIDLVKDVMMYKQQKVDAAREKIYTQVDYLMGQEIDKPEARAYMEDKMSGVIANINQKFKGVDLSSDGVTRAIQGEISSVLDDTVINAIAGTKEGKRVMKEIESIKQNHPELYSPINEWHALDPYYKWRSDGKAGSRLGGLHYSPYVDYTKEINKLVSDFRKNNEGKKIQTTEYDVKGNPTGGIIEVNVDELTDSQIRNFVSANLSENMRNQMRIEASYMAATNPVFSNPDLVSQYIGSYVERYDKHIGALEAKKKSVGDNKDIIDRIDSQIQEAKNQKAEAKREADMIIASSDPVAAANFVVTNNLFDKMVDAWRYDNTSFERKKDDLYFARLAEDRAQQKFLTDNAKSMVEISLAKEQLAQAKIEPLRKDYDYILIDCPPSLGIVTTNAFIAADEIIVPMTPELLPLKGMRMLDAFVTTLQRVKPSLRLGGVFIARFNHRKLNKVVEQAVKERYESITMNTRIRENIALAESAGSGKSIFEYDLNSNGAKDYLALTEEILSRNQ